jgi:DNA-binding GntR family transcriptional regulator
VKNSLSDYITSDLRQRILAGSSLPQKLTLPALAEHYQVSPMPVRIAVRDLLAESILLKQENGRFAVNPTKVGSAPATAQENSAPPTDWFDVVARDVIAMSLGGKSTPLKIVPTAERYGISRSLLHTIFHRLAGIGLLEHTPRRGWAVRPLLERDLDAYIEVRENLEMLALDLAKERLEASELQRLLAINQPAKSGKIDNSLHDYWVERSQNRYIQDFFERHHAYFNAMLTYAVISRKMIEDSKASHRRILEALLRKDWATARAELANDIRRLRPLLKATIQRLESGAELSVQKNDDE